jgi:hypothetical protein
MSDKKIGHKYEGIPYSFIPIAQKYQLECSTIKQQGVVVGYNLSYPFKDEDLGHCLLDIEIDFDVAFANKYNQGCNLTTTGTLYVSKHGRPPRTDYHTTTSGVMGDTIAEYIPELKPLTDLHLFDVDGLPTYYVGNSYYWFQRSLGLIKHYRHEQEHPLEYYDDVFRKYIVFGAHDSDAMMYSFLLEWYQKEYVHQPWKLKDFFTQWMVARSPYMKLHFNRAVSILFNYNHLNEIRRMCSVRWDKELGDYRR